MALNPTTLASLIKTNMLANPAIGAQPGAALDGLCTAIATAVVAHIQAAAVVPGTGLVAPGGGGPVTGASTVT